MIEMIRKVIFVPYSSTFQKKKKILNNSFEKTFKIVFFLYIMLLLNICIFSTDIIQYIDMNSYGKGNLIYRFESSRNTTNILEDLTNTLGFKHSKTIFNNGKILSGIIFNNPSELNLIGKTSLLKENITSLLPIFPFLKSSFSLKRSGEKNTLFVKVPLDKRIEDASYIFNFHFDNVLKMEKIMMIDKQGNLVSIESIGKIKIIKGDKNIEYDIPPSVLAQGNRLIFQITWLRKTNMLSATLTITVMVLLLVLWIWFSKKGKRST